MIAAATLAASLQLSAAQTSSIDAQVRSVMRAEHIPGLSLGIARSGHVLLARGYGVRDLATRAPADARTVYRIGSITKQFTAALVLREIEAGTLQLDSEIRGFTVEQLLAQTSGAPSYTDPGQSLDRALRSPPDFTPGSQWEYSNTNYYLLGSVLGAVRAESYEDLLDDEIIKPLQLHDTTFQLPTVPDRALGYAWNGSRNVAAAESDNDDPEVASSASAMSSNVVDLLGWLAALQRGSIVSRDDFSAMTTSRSLDDGTLTHYGYGFFVDDWYGWPVAQHSGLIDGFSGADAISTDDRLELVALTNEDRVSLVPLLKGIFAIVDTPKDAALVATLTHPPENEDAQTTALVRLLAVGLERAHPLGEVEAVDFTETSTRDGVSYVTYRITYDAGQYLLTLGRKRGAIVSLTFLPVR